MKKVISLLLIVCLACSFSSLCFADQAEDSAAFIYTAELQSIEYFTNEPSPESFSARYVPDFEGQGVVTWTVTATDQWGGIRDCGTATATIYYAYNPTNATVRFTGKTWSFSPRNGTRFTEQPISTTSVAATQRVSMPVHVKHPEDPGNGSIRNFLVELTCSGDCYKV